MHYEKQNETRIFLGGKAWKNIFENNQQIKNEKQMLRKKQEKKKGWKKTLQVELSSKLQTGWIEPQAPSSKLQNWNSNKNKQNIEMGKERNEEEGKTNLDKESRHLKKSNEIREQRGNKGA